MCRQTIVEGTQVRRERDGMRLVAHRLELREMAATGKVWTVAGSRLVLGTAPSCDVVLDDRTVSRHHCEILVSERRYLLRDLDSTNGTFVNGQEIIEAVLEPGARIQVGDTELVFQPKQRFLSLGASSQDRFGDLVGTSPAMRSLFGVLERVASTRLSCVVLGETGTGKELVARGLHQASPRAMAPFVVVDCAAVTASLVEAELFGHERGAFTGADRARAGAFELAAGGTLFLDEVGELALELQPKLLRVLEHREVKRLGAAQVTDVEVRIVAATHRDLARMVAEGTFREDLYFRLAEVVVEIPALREHREDIAPIAHALLAREAEAAGGLPGLSPDALAWLEQKSWPGNVRELRNTLRRAIALGTGTGLTARDLELRGFPARGEPPSALPARAELSLPGDFWSLPLRQARDSWNQRLDREYLVRLMDQVAGDEERAAAASGIHLKSLQRLLRQHGVRRA
ncbi:MAG: sigma 54-interacting transcriptional regulator [Polyangiaceae bacterium]|nr:sigma 54-interacting transcriptional regulator [Polyangiaceae bacterium]